MGPHHTPCAAFTHLRSRWELRPPGRMGGSAGCLKEGTLGSLTCHSFTLQTTQLSMDLTLCVFTRQITCRLRVFRPKFPGSGGLRCASSPRGRHARVYPGSPTSRARSEAPAVIRLCPRHIHTMTPTPEVVASGLEGGAPTVGLGPLGRDPREPPPRPPGEDQRERAV